MATEKERQQTSPSPPFSLSWIGIRDRKKSRSTIRILDPCNIACRVTSSVIINYVRAKRTLLGLLVKIYTFEETQWNGFGFLYLFVLKNVYF
jgi:hypothetical protein